MSITRKVKRNMARQAMKIAGIRHPNRKIDSRQGDKKASFFSENWMTYYQEFYKDLHKRVPKSQKVRRRQKAKRPDTLTT
jgi:hypothetical protein